MRTGQSLNQVCMVKLQVDGSSSTCSGAGALQADFILRDVLYRIALRWHADPIGLFLSGSAAPGNATEDSDIDLLQAMKPEVKITRSLYRIGMSFAKSMLAHPTVALSHRTLYFCRGVTGSPAAYGAKRRSRASSCGNAAAWSLAFSLPYAKPWGRENPSTYAAWNFLLGQRIQGERQAPADGTHAHERTQGNTAISEAGPGTGILCE